MPEDKQPTSTSLKLEGSSLVSGERPFRRYDSCSDPQAPGGLQDGYERCQLGEPAASDEEHRGTMTSRDAALFIMAELAGAGLLALSEAISNTGVFGIALIILCAGLAAYTGNLLGRTWISLETQDLQLGRTPVRQPYAEMGRRTYGFWMGKTILTLMNLTLFGMSVVLLLVSAELMQALAGQFLDLCSWVFIMAVLMTPATWLGSPKHLQVPSMVALGSILIAAVMMLVLMVTRRPQYQPEISLVPASLPSFCLGLSTIMFSFTGVSTLPTIQLDMKDRSKLSQATAYGFFGLCALYVPVAVTGYVVYGDRVNTNITYNLQPGPTLTIIQILLVVHYLGALIMLINPVCQNLEEAWNVPYTERLSGMKIVLRSCLMMLALLVAETVPSFGKIMNLIGGTFTLMLTFILPSLIYIRMRGEYRGSSKHGFKRYVMKRVFLLLLIVICVIVSCSVIYFSLYDILAPGAFHMPCYMYLFYPGESNITAPMANVTAR